MEPILYDDFFRYADHNWWFLGRKKIILSVLRQAGFTKNHPKKILDLGCGTGSTLLKLKEWGWAVGMDISPLALSYSQQRGVGPLVESSAQALPFKAGSFDLILGLDILEHLDDDLGALREIFSVLKPGGYALITVPAFKFLWSQHDELNYHRRRYVLNELRSRLETAGFILSRATYMNSLLFLPIFFIRWLKNHVLIRPKDGPLSDVKGHWPWVNSLLYFIFGLEANILSFMNLPFGVSCLGLARKPFS